MKMSDVKVREVMTHRVATLRPTDSLHEAAQRLAHNHVSGAPVVVDGKVEGMVSESDIIHAVTPSVPRDRGASVLDLLSVIGRARPRDSEHGKTVAEIMSPLVIQVSSEASIWKAASVMERRGVKRLPVVDENGYLLGIVSRADLVRAIAKEDAEIAADVIEAIRVLGEETIDGLEVEVAEGVAAIAGVADRKSTGQLATKLAARTPGVVEVLDRMTFEIDDTRIKADSYDRDPRRDWRPRSSINEGIR
jgi:CBS domain-containing protein